MHVYQNVIYHPTMFVAHRRVHDFTRHQSGNVVSNDVVNEIQGFFSFNFYLPHMRYVEQAGRVSHG